MLEREARSLAIQNATEKADFYASQLGVNRGPILSLSDHVGVAGPGEELATSRWRLSPAGLSSTPAR